MSATNRGGLFRQPDDNYATPAWCVHAILPHLELWDDFLVLDPCCGKGDLLDGIRTAPSTQGVRLRLAGIEINAGRSKEAKKRGFAVEKRDSLTKPRWGKEKPNAIVTNVPFGLAMPFVERCLVEVHGAGTVAILLRLNWLGSKKRAAFHKAHPSDVYVFDRRPSFTGGGTDATEYAFFVWGKGRGNRWSILDTPEK